MASAITFGGLASGLDTKAIIAALVGVEGRKVSFLQVQREGFNQKISSYNSLLDKMKVLQAKLETIADPDRFQAFTGTLSDNAAGIMTATPLGTAKAGSYQIEVTAIAQSAFLRSDGFGAADTDLGVSGDLTFQVGTTTTTIAIDGTNSTLNGIRDAINSSGGAVDASVVFDGTEYHLELRGQETGVANDVTVLAEPGLPPPLGNVLNITSLRSASDAAFTVDGQDYTSTDNTVEGAIEGVTLQLIAPQSGQSTPMTLTVAQNTEEIEKQLQDFVTAYNDMISYVKAQTAARVDNTGPLKALSGESAVANLRLTFGSLFATQVQNVQSNFDSLASLGIRTQSDGTLKIDSTDLKAALADDLKGVTALFTDPVEGIAVKVLAAVKQRTDFVDGTFKLRTEAFQESIKNLDARIRVAQVQLTKFEDNLVRRFAQFETLIGRLQQQGNALSGLNFGASSTDSDN